MRAWARSRPGSARSAPRSPSSASTPASWAARASPRLVVNLRQRAKIKAELSQLLVETPPDFDLETTHISGDILGLTLRGAEVGRGPISSASWRSDVKSRGRELSSHADLAAVGEHYRLPAADPRLLETPFSQVALDFWADYYARRPHDTGEEFENAEFEADVAAMLAEDDEWEDV
ncbi:MAG: hypothetical protein MZV65_31630 [Chromatiales bacterium]|nr:hypothetical protein [Chromatiales bacterium]